MSADGKRVVRRGLVDPDKQTVTLTSSGLPSETYGVTALPAAVKAYLTVLGLKTALLETPVAETAYAALMAGTLPEPQRASTGVLRSKIREAIAYAAATAMAAAANPGAKKAALTTATQDHLATTRVTAAALPRKTILSLAERGDVQEAYRKLWGGEDKPQASLLDLFNPMPAALDTAAE